MLTTHCSKLLTLQVISNNDFFIILLIFLQTLTSVLLIMVGVVKGVSILLARTIVRVSMVTCWMTMRGHAIMQVK